VRAREQKRDSSSDDEGGRSAAVLLLGGVCVVLGGVVWVVWVVGCGCVCVVWVWLRRKEMGVYIPPPDFFPLKAFLRRSLLGFSELVELVQRGVLVCDITCYAHVILVLG